MTVGLLDQEPGGGPGTTIRSFLAGATGVGDADDELRRATEAMAEDLDSIQRYTDALDRFDGSEGTTSRHARRPTAAELGFPSLDARLDELSGGQRTRVALAAIELARFDTLLLDEPTNNLDAEALERLEAWCSGFAGGVVVVSHDRAFLDACVNRFARTRPVHAASDGVRRVVDRVRRRAGAAT